RVVAPSRPAATPATPTLSSTPLFRSRHLDVHALGAHQFGERLRATRSGAFGIQGAGQIGIGGDEAHRQQTDAQQQCDDEDPAQYASAAARLMGCSGGADRGLVVGCDGGRERGAEVTHAGTASTAGTAGWAARTSSSVAASPR